VWSHVDTRTKIITLPTDSRGNLRRVGKTNQSEPRNSIGGTTDRDASFVPLTDGEKEEEREVALYTVLFVEDLQALAI
jgi:hypothetical protein